MKKLFCNHWYNEVPNSRIVNRIDELSKHYAQTKYKCEKCGKEKIFYDNDYPTNKYVFKEKCKGLISDGSHTFDELYYHRMILFAVICNSNQDVAWKSKLHHDGTMYDNYFIVGVDTPAGQYSYHYHMDHWNKFRVRELIYAPEWDGHMPKDVDRLLTLYFNK